MFVTPHTLCKRILRASFARLGSRKGRGYPYSTISATALPQATVSALPPRSRVRSVRSPSVRSIAETIASLFPSPLAEKVAGCNRCEPVSTTLKPAKAGWAKHQFRIDLDQQATNFAGFGWHSMSAVTCAATHKDMALRV